MDMGDVQITEVKEEGGTLVACRACGETIGIVPVTHPNLDEVLKSHICSVRTGVTDSDIVHGLRRLNTARQEHDRRWAQMQSLEQAFRAEPIVADLLKGLDRARE